jgi:hypothetical protein
MKTILKCTLSVLAIAASPAWAEFSDAGTDYSNAPVENWSEDSINDYVSMANSFACILKNSRPDALPNASYEALISEVECGLEDEVINASGVSNRPTLSSSILKTSRASNTSNQEGQFWFNAQSGNKFVGGITIKKSPTTLPPYGEWGLSYYKNDNNGSTDSFTPDNSPIKGYVDIAGAGGTAVTLRSYDYFNYGASDNGYQAARIEYSDATLASAKVLGRSKGVGSGGNYDKLVAAKTNATHLFRAVSTDGGNNFTGQCMKRDSTWKTAHRYGVYNKSTGAKIKLSGGFGFRYTEGSSSYRGYLGSWGAHFDNPATAFSPTTPTKTVTRQSDGAEYTLSWAPGKLHERTLVVEPLPTTNGATQSYKTWVDNGGRVNFVIKNNSGAFEGRFFNASTGAAITDPYDGITGDEVITTTDITAHPWMTGHLYSEEKRTNITWTGGNSISFFSEKDVSTDTTLLAATYTALYARHDRSAGSNLPVDPEDWRDSSNPHQFMEKSDSKDDVYYFTGKTPPTGYLARTLYTDPNSNGPDSPVANDKPVMFNFSANDSTKTFKSYDATPTTGSLEKGTPAEVQWPHKNIELRNAGSTKIYSWGFGGFVWDNSIVAYNASNVLHSIEQPLTLTYTHDATKDLNNGKTSTFYVEAKNNPVPALCPEETTNYPSAGDKMPKCTVTPTGFGTKVFKLRYNGNWLSGLPNANARGSFRDQNAYWLRMINPTNGVVVYGQESTPTQYVLKAEGIGEAFLPETDAAKCNDPAGDGTGAGNDADKISFASRAEFGWTLAQLPSLTDYPLPTMTWSSQPAVSALKCSVEMGDTSGC